MGLLDDDRPRRADRDEGERPSWRDLDRKRDRSAHSSPGDDDERKPPTGSKAEYLAKRASTQARSDADALFADPARDKATTRLRDAAGPAEVEAAVTAFKAKWPGLPEDGQALIQALKHPSPEIQLEALAVLDVVIPTLTGPSLETTLRGIGLFRLSARDMGARKAAKRLLKAHGVEVGNL